jgi:hypothetical protein
MKTNNTNMRRGVAMVLSMLFLVVFASLSIAMLTMSTTNAKIAVNHSQANTAMSAALSGLECAKYLIARTPTFETDQNTVSDTQAQTIWTNFCSTLQSQAIGGVTVEDASAFTDTVGSGEQIIVGPVNYGDAGQTFTLRFYRYDDALKTIKMDSTGQDNGVARQIKMPLTITKEAEVAHYAIASRGRMWVTQNSEIWGPVYSTWNRPEVGAGIETTSDTTIHGTISTIISLQDMKDNDLSMETLNEYDQALFQTDGEGNILYDDYGYPIRVVSSDDACQGQHLGIEYGVEHQEMPGLDPADYTTSGYKNDCSTIGAYDSIKVEYFPHGESGYTTPKYSSAKKLYRKVYENKTFSNVTIPQGSHCLFKNCTFEDVLFVESKESYQDSSSTTNNIRFEDCNFNGTIVTDVPSTSSHYSWWMRNVLYFTGEATFDNQSAYPEMTVMAPNFNVNLGNTGSLDSGDGNVVSGLVVGGIVDVRGNATIYGSIISMYDTSEFSSGYITNIGAADDGGSESVGYVGGKITIVPPEDKLLPSGIMSPIVITPSYTDYEERPCPSSGV